MDVNSVRSHSNEKQPVEHSTSTNGEHKHTEKEKSASVFINHAAIAWHESRREWTGDQSQQPQRMIKDPIISWSATYEDLLSTHEPFSEPIPLPVSFLLTTILTTDEFCCLLVLNLLLVIVCMSMCRKDHG
ncbi:DUF4050 domain-containing protein [Salix suchowensis]|nr:DUF4050 domain-containing protein [Salix suchowensis]